MKLEHLYLHQKGCEAGEPTFPGRLCLWPKWPRGAYNSVGWGCKTGILSSVIERCLEACSDILTLYKCLLLVFICCFANIDPECIVH